MSNETLIYWAPAFENNQPIDWNILYTDLESLHDSLRDKKSDTRPNQNFFYCPAFTNVTKSTFTVRNPIQSHFKIQNQNEVIPTSKNHISSTIFHPPSIENCATMIYGLKWIFFSEEDVEMTLTSPYFSQSQHLQYGSVVPGRIKINSWFRAINLEFNLWPNVNEFKVEENETIAYFNFNTDKNIKLVRFEMNQKLHQYSNAGIQSTVWESWVPLKKRYDRFKKSRMNELVLKEIKNNIL